jgi:ferric-dicitrate binding protein FerR (iron transport regulator)
MQNLFKKYIDNQCSPVEIKELLTYFNIPENETLLRNFILQNLEDTNSVDGEEYSQWLKSTELIYEKLKKQIDSEKVKIVPFYRKGWFKVAAAAVLLIGSIAVYQFAFTNDMKQQIVLNKPENKKQDVSPGGNKAILTLSDGSAIMLDSAANGTLTQQGNSKIIKLTNGQLVYNSLNVRSDEVIYNTITTPRGGQYQLTLADGSKVWLNAVSSLRFPATFTGKERRVELTGEAYFEVAKNANMPFKINVEGRSEVEVLGTHFNINSYVDEATVNTTLLEGSVKVTGFAKHNSKLILPGQQAQLHEDGLINLNKNVNIEEVMAWKNGNFYFNKADLQMVLRQLSRWYDVEIVYEGNVPQREFEGEMERGLNLSQVLKILERNNVYFKIEKNKLIVMK